MPFPKPNLQVMPTRSWERAGGIAAAFVFDKRLIAKRKLFGIRMEEISECLLAASNAISTIRKTADGESIQDAG